MSEREDPTHDSDKPTQAASDREDPQAVDPEVQSEADDKGVDGTGEGTEGELAAKSMGAGNATPDAPPKSSTPTGPGGVPRTTTTGDPAQDFRVHAPDADR
ncbi:MAG: hypothetical protein QOE83_1088 [Actinomycetota bacterium]|jgi:hypothetical protein|nr:hypothetical protein [Actinomycetota bacterium]